MKISEILSSWEQEDLIPVFEEHNITEEMLSILNEDLIKELIPNIGTRIKFIENLKSHMVDSLDDANTSISEFVIDSDGNLIEDSAATASTSSNNSATSDVLVPLENRELSCHSLNELLNCKPTFPNFDLKTLLDVSPLGNSVVNYYNTNQILDETRRNRLVDIIMKHLFKYHVTHRLTHADYNIVTSKIITEFPKEAAQIYYIPSIKKRESFSGHSVVAKGKLVDKARNLIHKSGVITRKRKGANDFEEPPEKLILLDENLKSSQTFLQTRSEPWDEVTIHWNNTFSLRRKDNCKTLEDFLKKWPILSDPRAESLINSDFDKLFPKCGLRLFSRWKKFFVEVSNVRKENCKSLDILEILKNDEDENCTVAVHLKALAHLIPSKGRRHLPNKKIWKYSIQETVESIIMHAKNAADIDRLIQIQRDQAQVKGVNIQPYILIEGPCEREIRNIYIVIDKIKYHHISLLKALDICFKLFHVFDANYPPQGEHIWHIIEKCVYGIDLKNKSFPYLMDIIHHFRDFNFD